MIVVDAHSRGNLPAALVCTDTTLRHQERIPLLSVDPVLRPKRVVSSSSQEHILIQRVSISMVRTLLFPIAIVLPASICLTLVWVSVSPCLHILGARFTLCRHAGTADCCGTA